MTEQASNTANHQRLKEMMFHLTPRDAVIPYNICYDSGSNIWVAAKGGLFKIDPNCTKILYERKNPFPKKIAPFTQVLCHKDKIVYLLTDDKANLTEFRIFDLSGEVEHEQFINGKVQSVAVNEGGDIFLTKQPIVGGEESIIYKSSMDCPLGWEELSSSLDFSFQALCVFDENTLGVATVSLPINMYSRQSIKWVDSNTGEIVQTFSAVGKADGQIYFPRCMRRYRDGLLVMDKTGRFQLFGRDGQFTEICARIDAYIGNGFALADAKNDGVEAIVACSGIVVTKSEETICDDWIEAVKLNGSSWVD